MKQSTQKQKLCKQNLEVYHLSSIIRLFVVLSQSKIEALTTTVAVYKI